MSFFFAFWGNEKILYFHVIRKMKNQQTLVKPDAPESNILGFTFTGYNCTLKFNYTTCVM